MGEIMVLVEHRKGEIRDITREMLYKAGELCARASHELVAVVLAGEEADGLAQEAAKMADKVLVFQDVRFQNFDSHLYGEVLARLVQERKPVSDPHWTYIVGNGCGACSVCQVRISPGDGLREYPAGGRQAVCYSADLQRQTFFESFLQKSRRLCHYREIRGLSGSGRSIGEKGGQIEMHAALSRYEEIRERISGIRGYRSRGCGYHPGRSAGIRGKRGRGRREYRHRSGNWRMPWEGPCPVHAPWWTKTGSPNTTRWAHPENR